MGGRVGSKLLIFGVKGTGTVIAMSNNDRSANNFPGVRLFSAASGHPFAALFFALLLILTFAAPAALAAAPANGVVPPEIRETTLANGLKVIVWPDRDIPNVALYNWVRVGSRNEAPGITGLAHFFEHMMFNGTSKRAPGEFDREMEARGGSNNAFTSDDVTVYQDWFPRSALDLVFELEGDRLANLSFKKEVVESERNVVYSERRLRVEDNNQGYLWEQVQSTAFVAHPYQIPTIGWPADIRGWRTEDLQAFFKTYYAPNNCTLVVAGAVEPEEIFALARKHLEPIPQQPAPLAVRTTEPAQLGEKRLTVERRAQTPLLHIAYKTPAVSDPQAPAIALLLSILTEGDASRLHRLLVEEKKLAIGVGGHWHEGFDPALMHFLVTLPQGGEPAAVESLLDAELARVVSEGVSAAELQRARNLATASYWKARATIDGKAQLLGEFEVMRGGWRRLFDAAAAYDKVTQADIKSAASGILRKQVRTVGVLLPAARAEGG
jgi:zinc protease